MKCFFRSLMNLAIITEQERIKLSQPELGTIGERDENAIPGNLSPAAIRIDELSAIPDPVRPMAQVSHTED
jgi:hypothetical protein